MRQICVWHWADVNKSFTKIMTLAPSTNIVFPDKLFVVAEGIYLCSNPMKIEGHRIDSWEVPYINILHLVKKFWFSLDDFISNFSLSLSLSLKHDMNQLVLVTESHRNTF